MVPRAPKSANRSPFKTKTGTNMWCQFLDEEILGALRRKEHPSNAFKLLNTKFEPENHVTCKLIHGPRTGNFKDL